MVAKPRCYFEMAKVFLQNECLLNQDTIREEVERYLLRNTVMESIIS
jgi:hypothetical protein